MRDPGNGVVMESDTLAQTVLQHLPDLFKNHNLASTVFRTLRKASRVQRSLPHITPLLCPLTSVSLTAADAKIRYDAATTCVILVRALVARRAKRLASAYMRDLATLTQLLIERDSPIPLPCILPTFAESAHAAGEPEEGVSTFATVIVPPIPVSPQSLEALLYLMAVFIPSRRPLPLDEAFTQEPSSPSVITADKETAFPKQSSCRLWIGIGAAARAAVLHVASSHVLLSARCGSRSALAAATVVERALDVTSGCVVPQTTRNRILATAESILSAYAGNSSTAHDHRSRTRLSLYRICLQASSTGRINSSTWAFSGVRDAISDDGEVGLLLRSLSGRGLISSGFHEKRSPIPTERLSRAIRPPRKRRRVDTLVETPDSGAPQNEIQQSLSQGAAVCSSDDYSSSPTFALKKELEGLECIYNCVGNAGAMQTLARVAALTADALALIVFESTDLEAIRVWVSFADSISSIIYDVCSSVLPDCSSKLWKALLFLAMECTRIAASLHDMADLLSARGLGPSKSSTIANGVGLDSLFASIIAVLNVAGLATDSAAPAVPLSDLASLMWKLGEILEVMPPSHLKKLIAASYRLQSFALRWPPELSMRDREALLKCCFHLPVDSTGPESTRRIAEVIPEVRLLFNGSRAARPKLAAAALHALGDLTCMKVGCFRRHLSYECEIDYRDFPSMDVDTWNNLYDDVSPLLQGTGVNEVIAAATRCVGNLILHAPPSRRGEAATVFVQALWHPTCRPARLIVGAMLPLIISKEDHLDSRISVFPATKENLEQSRSFRRNDSWDEAADLFASTEDSGCTARLLGVELQRHVQGTETLHTAREADKNHQIPDLAPLLVIMQMNSTEPVMKKVAASAADVVISMVVAELLSWASGMTSTHVRNAGRPERCRALSRSPLSSWNRVLALVWNDDQQRRCRRLVSDIGDCTSRNGVQQMYLGMVRSHSPLQVLTASYLSSRMREWIPLAITRMERSESFSQQLADIMMLQGPEAIWKKIPRYVVGILLRKRDEAALEALAMRVHKSIQELVEFSCADALARSALLNPKGFDMSRTGPVSFVSGLLDMSARDVIEQRSGKIVQRIVMEIGGNNEHGAEVALVSLGRILRVGNHPNPSGFNVAGAVLSSHFMLVMDAVSRGLFRSRASRHTRILYLRMLDGVLRIANDHLHLYIPKILATLKMALDSLSGDRLVSTEVMKLWTNFLIRAGACRVMPHFSSILAILLPVFSAHHAVLSPVVLSLTQEASARLQTSRRWLNANDWSQIIMLLRISTHIPFTEAAQVLENRISGVSSSSATDEEGRRANKRRPEELVKTCDVVGNIISRHSNGVIEVMAVDHLLQQLRLHRSELDHIRRSHDYSNASTEDSRINIVATLLHVLVSNLNKTTSKACQEKILECIGEVGALDPSVFAQCNETNRGARKFATASGCREPFPRKIQPLVALLLNNYLVPTLGRGENSDGATNLPNRIGLVIQELLRVCDCRRDTAVRASNSREDRSASSIPVDWDSVLVGQTREENAIFFWENLDHATRTSAQPYLAEPFDVQHYTEVFGGNSAGDLATACQPVWRKVKAASPSDVLPTAREWRRQMVVQLADYIGMQGKYGSTLKAVRPVLRYIDSVAALLFPVAIFAALDVQRRKGSDELQRFLCEEVSIVMKECASPQIIFETLDTLRCWREERSKHRGRLIPIGKVRTAIAGGSERNSDSSRGRISVIANIENERESDPLTPLVDLTGSEATQVSLLIQAEAAFRSRSYARAVLLAECHIRNVRKRKSFSEWPMFVDALRGKERSRRYPDASEEAGALAILQKSFAGLEDSESMAGVSALRGDNTLSDSIVDAESIGRFDEALIMYERALTTSPRNAELHDGFLRCLMALGHWETVIAHAEGLALSAKLGEMHLRYSAQTLAIGAAWRLGRWDKIEEFGHSELDAGDTNLQTERPWTLDFTISLGKTLACLQRNERSMARVAARAARSQLLLPTLQMAREGYSRSYPSILLLHSLSDVEDVVNYKCQNIETAEDGPCSSAATARHAHPERLLVSLAGRIAAVTSSLTVKEPLLAVTKICFEALNKQEDAAKISLQLAGIAQEEGNLRAASAYAFNASAPSSTNSGAVHAVAMQLAQIRRAQGHADAALQMVRDEIGRLFTIRVREEKKSTASFSMQENSEELCAAYSLAATWMEELRCESSDVILSYLEAASSYGAQHEEPLYALGRHYDKLLQTCANSTTDSSVRPVHGAVRSSRRSTANLSSSESRTPQIGECTSAVIRFFSDALCTGHTRIFEALPRMLTVWFDYNSAAVSTNSYLLSERDDGKVKQAIKKAFNTIPLYMWMTAIPQLMSRILHPRKIVRDELVQLLARVVYHFPDQAIWMVLPSALLKSDERKSASNEVLNAAVHVGKKLRMSEQMQQGQEEPRRLRVRFHAGLSIVRCFVDICATMLDRDKRGRVEDCSREFMSLKRALKVPSMNPVIPTLSALTVRLPTSVETEHRPFSEEPCRIVGIDDYALVMSSLMRPRRISLVGSDGEQYRFLAKRETAGDMRKDSRLVEFIVVVNRLLSKDQLSRGRDLELKTYAVLPLTEETGLIEWVDDLDPMRKLVREQHMKLPEVPHTTAIQAKYQKTADHERFLEWAVSKFPPVLDQFFLQRFGNGTDPHAWLQARSLWTKSVAVWSISGYIVGLGDRHGENVLVETTTGRCVHVDFAMLFDKGKTLKVPEVVPFRLTPNMVSAMGIAGYEGAFRIVCENVMGILRRNSEALLGVLETFLHDPLADWGKSDTKGAGGTVVATKEAWQTRAAVKAKLTGVMDESGLPFSIQGQVQRLIQEASSLENLSKMYLWWSGWV